MDEKLSIENHATVEIYTQATQMYWKYCKLCVNFILGYELYSIVR